MHDSHSKSVTLTDTGLMQVISTTEVVFRMQETHQRILSDALRSSWSLKSTLFAVLATEVLFINLSVNLHYRNARAGLVNPRDG